ncbi:MAG: FxSxx-COOH cyclophane-containing RiPP peptide [Gammaproteobacteria bacterium]
MGDEDLDIECNLVDLSGVDLESLISLRDSALAQSIRRVRLAAENPDEAALGFQQFI